MKPKKKMPKFTPGGATLRLPEELREFFQERAIENMRSLNAELVLSLREFAVKNGFRV